MAATARRSPYNRFLIPIMGMGLCFMIFMGLKNGSPSEPSAKKAIQAILDRQVEAWNQRDLTEYMVGYWQDERMLFFADGGKQANYHETYEQYRRRYQGERKDMGHLQLDGIEIEVLGPTSALVHGSWGLTFEDDQPAQSGPLTLVFAKKDQGWCIVHEHRSE